MIESYRSVLDSLYTQRAAIDSAIAALEAIAGPRPKKPTTWSSGRPRHQKSWKPNPNTSVWGELVEIVRKIGPATAAQINAACSTTTATVYLPYMIQAGAVEYVDASVRPRLYRIPQTIGMDQ